MPVTFPTEFQPWQIPASFRGTFTSMGTVTAHKRWFRADVVNVDPDNREFFVKLRIENAGVPYTTIVAGPVKHGSGISADEVAVEKALDCWLGRPIVSMEIDGEDDDEE